MNPDLKSRLALTARLAVSALILWLLARSIAWREVSDILLRLQVEWVLLALLIYWAAQIVSSLRCAYLARALGGDLSLHMSIRAHFLGLWFNQVLPTSLGGDVVKLAVLAKPVGTSIALRACILDRLSGLVFLMAAIFVMIPMYFRVLPHDSMSIGLATLSTGFLVSLATCMWASNQIRIRFQQRPLVLKLTQLFFDIWTLRKPVYLGQQAWTSAIVHFNGIIAYALLGVAMDIPVDVLQFLLIVPLVFLVAVLPISFAGWGVREAGAVWLFGLVGIDQPSALAVSIAFGFLLLIAAIPGAALLVFYGNSVSPKVNVKTDGK